MFIYFLILTMDIKKYKTNLMHRATLVSKNTDDQKKKKIDT